MGQRNEFEGISVHTKKVWFNELINEIRTECDKMTIESINKSSNKVSELFKLYEELKNNYGVDYRDKFVEIANLVKKCIITIETREKTTNAKDTNDVNSLETNQKEGTIEELFNKLVGLITQEQKFENIKSTINTIYDIDDLVKRLAKKISSQGQSGEITLEQQNNYFEKLNSLGFRRPFQSVLGEINEKLRVVRKLIDENEVAKNLSETNQILSEYLVVVEKIREMIEDAKTSGIICEKQEILYDVLLEEYKQQIFEGRIK